MPNSYVGSHGQTDSRAWATARDENLFGMPFASCGFAIFFMLCIGFFIRPAIGAEPENFMKAAFLYNFSKFVDWPNSVFKSPDAPVILCILGKDPLGGPALRTIENRPVGERTLLVRQCQRIEEVQGCHSLFISSSEKENLSDILSYLRGKPILTVSEMETFAHRGGMINFVKVKKKIRFEINPDAVRQAGLKISSRLLKLARIIKDIPKKEEDR